jgi:hypothetical protein
MTKLRGDKLRDNVAQLLRMKFQNVDIEKRLETTTADILFVDDTNPIFPRKIAVEAKDWKQRLSSEEIAQIHTLYAPSLASRTIDYLWIVSNHPLSGSPRLSLDQLANVKYSTFDEFRGSLMNFTGLLNNNVLMFEHDDASKNFIPTRIRNAGGTLFDYVTNWLKSQYAGLIVYGGYGIGKTTFSLYLANILSEKYLAQESDRIPIRIALGGMYSKQDLVALICSTLSGGEGLVAVKDFSYGLFLEMNRQGRYLLILDGFDEMRHAMDLDDFIYTFEQMKPLFAGNAKVVILGRPDSFLSTQEEDKVLSALFDDQFEKNKRLDTVEVSFFSKDEVVTYINKYLERRNTKLTDKQQKNYDALLRELPNTEDSILSRPVQLKMFTRLIDECLENDELLNRYELYKTFIYSFLGREGQKPARQPTEGVRGETNLRDDRAKFMQAVAWWVLISKKENRFLPEEIPLEIVPASLKVGAPGSAAVREAIVGSVIEPISKAGVLGSKARKYFFFSHKSYLEFLVSNYFTNNSFSRQVYREFLANINGEILTFLEEGPYQGVDNLRRGLLHNVGLVDIRVIEVCATDKNLKKEIAEGKKQNYHPSLIYTHYFYLNRQAQDPVPYLLARLADSTTVESILATLNCISTELEKTGSRELVRAVILSCITGIAIVKVRAYVDKNDVMQIYRVDLESVRGAILSQCVWAGKKEFVLSSEALTGLIQKVPRGSLLVNIPKIERAHDKISVPADYILKELGPDYLPPVTKLIEKRGNNLKPVFPVEFIGDAAEVLDTGGPVISVSGRHKG